MFNCLIYTFKIFKILYNINVGTHYTLLPHDDGYMDGRSQLKVRTQVKRAQSSLVVIHPSTNRARRYWT